MRKIRLLILLSFIILICYSLVSCKKQSDNVSPKLDFSQPMNNTIVTEDSLVVIELSKYEKDISISKVELYLDNILKATMINYPYRYEWQTNHVDIGNHILKVIAYGLNITTTVKLTISVVDFRTKFLGNFYFTVITTNWRLGQPNKYDTTRYNGIIRKFSINDIGHDLYSDDETKEDSTKKITVVFSDNSLFTSIIEKNGHLMDKSGYHYCHQGDYLNKDTIKFTIGCLGGLGGGWSYNVKGIKK
jgi:hypothetical protein